MKVYHGGTEIITFPLVTVGRDDLDFGKGFYVTDIKTQAELWASKIAERRKVCPIINIYELDINVASTKYRYKKFDRYDKEWLDFIADNRNGKKKWENYDLIEGGVADDRVVDTVESYISGLMSEDVALKRLSHYAPNNQLCLINQELVNECLMFVDSTTLISE